MNMTNNKKIVFISGATGYIGTRLIKQLLQRGYKVIALVRKGSEHKVPRGANIAVADPFNADSFQQFIPKNSVFVQLLGVSHPSPRKAQQFKDIDLRSVKASADAAADAGVSQFVYVSVSMSPTKLMKAYQDVRREGEEYCKSKNLNCTFIRPWYVLGPGHWWPIILYPFYGLAELIPSWREQARTKALVTIREMIDTLINAIENDPSSLRILEIKNIKSAAIDKNTSLKTLTRQPSYL